jgi:hypothetical protein
VRLHQWRHAADLPAVLDCAVPRALANLGSLDLIPEPLVKSLLGAHRLLRQLECILAVAVDGPVGRERLSRSLASLLVRAGGARDLPQLEEAVADATGTVRAAFGDAVDQARCD